LTEDNDKIEAENNKIRAELEKLGHTVQTQIKDSMGSAMAATMNSYQMSGKTGGEKHDAGKDKDNKAKYEKLEGVTPQDVAQL